MEKIVSLMQTLKEKKSFIKNKAQWKDFIDFTNKIETPFLAINTENVRQKYRTFIKNYNYAKIYFAVKACPIKEVLEVLRDEGSHFDIASVNEMDMLLDLNIPPERMSFGNTIKKGKDIKYAYQKGIRLFVTDSEHDLINIAKYAPKSKVFVRIMTTGTGAEWPLSRKFGCHPTLATKILTQAKEKKLIPYGISFHVGSQQTDVGQWDEAIATASHIFEHLQKDGTSLKMLNIGGGQPVHYKSEIPDEKKVSGAISKFLKSNFKEVPEIFIEPGRVLVAESGILVSEIILMAKKSELDTKTWVYIDAGKFGGLIETLDESIKYPIVCTKKGHHRRVILTGPTCDSMDILYENTEYFLPETVKSGDRIYFLSTGAYTLSYSAVAFNGFLPMKYVVYNGSET